MQSKYKIGDILHYKTDISDVMCKIMQTNINMLLPEYECIVILKTGYNWRSTKKINSSNSIVGAIGRD